LHASMVLTRSREGHQGPWHAVLHAIAQGIACPCAVCMMIPRECGHASCSRPLDTRLPHTYLSTLFSTRLEHPESGMQDSLLWHVLLRACFLTRQRFSDPLIHPSAPRRGVERRLRERVMRPRIMQQAVRHKASSRTPPSPLFPTSLEHPESGMQNVVLLLVDLRACCVHTSPPLRPTAPHKRSSPKGPEVLCQRVMR
jgi:hypothetical protein